MFDKVKNYVHENREKMFYGAVTGVSIVITAVACQAYYKRDDRKFWDDLHTCIEDSFNGEVVLTHKKNYNQYIVKMK